MRRLCAAFAAVVLLASDALAQDDWRALLESDLVNIEADQMLIDRFSLDRIEFPGTAAVQFQVKYHAEAPAEGVMSRDNFVYLSTGLGELLVLGVYSEAYGVTMSQFLDAYDSTDLDAPIGTPDLEVNLFMTEEGLQIEIVNTATGERFRETQTWEQIFS